MIEQLLVEAILAERAREAARIRLAFEGLQLVPSQVGRAAAAGPSRFPAVDWLRQLASSLR